MENYLNDIDLSSGQPPEKIFTDLVNRALTGKQSDFEFIRSWLHRKAVKAYQKAVETVVQIFIELYDSTYKLYTQQVAAGTQDIQTLLALKQFKQCLDFYQQEHQITEDMLAEYSEYIWNWHIIDMLMGNLRAEKDLWDHRGNKPDGK